MTDNIVNAVEQEASQEYEECAGKGCHNAGVHYLKVIFLNKSGWFCDSCKISLMADNLATLEAV